MAEHPEGIRARRVTTCSFCGKSSRDVGPMVEGPGDIYICANCVDLAHNIIRQEKRKLSSATAPAFGSIPSPRQISGLLDACVVGQQHAKKALSVAIHNHYRRLTRPTGGAGGAPPGGDVEIGKRNVLLIGPAGCGKTLLARTLARVLDRPFAVGDATTLMHADSYGEDVSRLLLKLLQNAEFDLEAAQQGIIYIDNFDAAAHAESGFPNRVKPCTRVLQSLLEVMDGVVAEVPPPGGRKLPGQPCIQIDTRQILFICAGTSGVIPPFLGRFPLIVTLEPADAETLARILTEPNDALVTQYQKLFRMNDADLEFTPGALRMIAERAIQRGSGAHALAAVCEEVLLDWMYRLAEQPGGKYVVTENVIRAIQP